MRSYHETRQQNYTTMMTFIAVSAALTLLSPPVGSFAGLALLLLVAGWLIRSANTDTPLRNRTMVVAATVVVGLMHLVFLGSWLLR